MDEYALTHSRAFSLHDSFVLVAGVDPLDSNRADFEESYKVKTYRNLPGLLKHERPDVIVVANPTHEHSSTIESVLACYRPRAILCEKPLAIDDENSSQIVDLCIKNSVPVYINYIRRGDSGIQEIRRRIISREFQPPYKGVVWYSKGIIHNGSHFLDLMRFWFGDVQNASIIHPGETFTANDAEPDARFQFCNASVVFCAAQESNFSHYTIELIAANGRLRIEKNGDIGWQPAVNHPTLVGFRQLAQSSDIIQNSMPKYQLMITNELYKALTQQNHALCSGRDGLSIQKCLSELVTSSKSYRV